MRNAKPTTRLFLDTSLAEGGELPLERDQAHFLRSVLRLAPGAALLVFNGRDGEWAAEIAALDKKEGRLRLLRRTRPQAPEPDHWLAFAPIKAGRIDWLVEKATELGVSRLLPVVTRRTVVERVRLERLEAQAREAAEQCERLTLPQIDPPQPLAALLAAWPAQRRLLVGDESGNGATLPQVLQAVKAPLALLVGPEGGFAAEERALLAAAPAVLPVSLGPRILRAETAALAGLAVIQALAGDWNSGPRGTASSS